MSEVPDETYNQWQIRKLTAENAELHDQLVKARAAVEPCGGEQEHFEKWATENRYDMQEHPLHYLFLDAKTSAARQGWKAALRYAETHLTDDSGNSK